MREAAPHRARGLCSTHYNQARYLPDQRHVKVTVPCTYCMEPCLKGRTMKYSGRFCSLICRDLWRIETGTNPAPSAEAVIRGREARIRNREATEPKVGLHTRLPISHPARWFGSSSAVEYIFCIVCGSLMASHVPNPRIYCSKQCRSRAVGVRKRATRSQRHMKRRAEIYERDAWTCWLCGGSTARAYSFADPLSPTLDHLHPRSLGGDDTAENLATAHLVCNSRRGVGDVVTFPLLNA